MNFMNWFELATYCVVAFGIYTCGLALKNIHCSDWDDVFKDKYHESVFIRFVSSVLFAFLVWLVAYIAINTIHHQVATGVLPGSIEMTWRLGHLVLNLAIVRIAQMVLFVEKIRKTQVTTPRILFIKSFTFRIPIYINTVTKSYF
jgi:hypothetical protein